MVRYMCGPTHPGLKESHDVASSANRGWEKAAVHPASGEGITELSGEASLNLSHRGPSLVNHSVLSTLTQALMVMGRDNQVGKGSDRNGISGTNDVVHWKRGLCPYGSTR